VDYIGIRAGNDAIRNPVEHPLARRGIRYTPVPDDRSVGVEDADYAIALVE
jgi:hypothetical protein